MAARSNREHQQSVVEAIKTTQIVNRLEKHFNGELDTPLDATQLKAAEMLLARTLPVLSAVEQTNVNPMDSMSEAQIIQQLQALISANPELTAQLLAQVQDKQVHKLDMNQDTLTH